MVSVAYEKLNFVALVVMYIQKFIVSLLKESNTSVSA